MLPHVERPNRFVGREHDLEELGRAARRARLTSVIGPPGIGKSRLVAEWCAGREANERIMRCTLSAPEGVVRTVAAVLGLPASDSPSDLAARIGYALDARAIAFLVLDEAEGALAALADVLPEWLALAPRLRVIASSRVLLRLPGEEPLELGPLDLESAIELLGVRAREVGARIEGDPSLATLAARLDRLPLALELAAARMRSLTPSALLERLQTKHLDVLAGGYRNAPARHRTLTAAFDASYDLLDPAARHAWTALALFCQPFDLSAASAVVGLDALDCVERLREASLLHGEPHAMYMLESVRAYGRERQDEDAYARHCAWALACDPPPIADLEQAAERALAIGENEAAARALLRVHDALRGREASDPRKRRLEMIDESALDPVTRTRLALAQSESSSPSESMTLAERALKMAIELRDPELELDARHRLSVLAYLRGDDDAAFEQASAAIALARDPSRAAPIEASLGVNLHVRGRHEEAHEHYTRALELARAAGDRASEARTLGRLGFLAMDLGRHEEAEAHLERTLELALAIGDAHTAALARGYLGNVMRYRRRLADAREHYRAAATEMRALGDRAWEAVVTMDLGILWLDHQRTREAIEALSEALAAARTVENARVIGLIEGYLAAAHACAGDADGFRSHLEAARTIAERVAGLAEVVEVHALHAQVPAADLDRPRHGHAELAARIVRARAAPSANDLCVSSDRSAFAIGGARVDLSSHEATQRIFALLVEERIERAGSVVATATLIAAGWPNERVGSRAAQNRLRVAIAQLRRAGLSPLQTVRGGYRLDPDVVLRTS
jgi:tetratricopeptide (TPR) repeat protein